MRNIYDLYDPQEVLLDEAGHDIGWKTTNGDYEIWKFRDEPQIWLTYPHPEMGRLNWSGNDARTRASRWQVKRKIMNSTNAKVLIGGLGIGLDAILIEDAVGTKVSDVTIVEKQPEVIAMVEPVITYPGLTVIEDGIKHYLETTSDTFDICWFDIFGSPAALYPDLWPQLDALAQTKLNPGGKIFYWQDTIQAIL